MHIDSNSLLVRELGWKRTREKAENKIENFPSPIVSWIFLSWVRFASIIPLSAIRIAKTNSTILEYERIRGGNRLNKQKHGMNAESSRKVDTDYIGIIGKAFIWCEESHDRMRHFFPANSINESKDNNHRLFWFKGNRFSIRFQVCALIPWLGMIILTGFVSIVLEQLVFQSYSFMGQVLHLLVGHC